jgi:hypothetical protein
VLEETGIKAEFSGVLAFREQLDHKYGAADFYFTCLLQPDQVTSVNIQDVGEVQSAQWIPLSEITTNDDSSKYRLLPNAFKFVSLVQQGLK